MRTGIQSHTLGLKPQNLHQILTLYRASPKGRLSRVIYMNKTPRTFKQLAAGTAAIVLTFAAAGAAVAVNLGTSSSGEVSKVGNLPAAQPISAATASSSTVPVVPSTIYVDVTVPYDVVVPSPAASASPSARSASSGGSTNSKSAAPMSNSAVAAASDSSGSAVTATPIERESERESEHEPESEPEHQEGRDDDD